MAITLKSLKITALQNFETSHQLAPEHWAENGGRALHFRVMKDETLDMPEEAAKRCVALGYAKLAG